MTHPAESEYDAIAGAYKDSKRLSFRKYIEEYTLFEMLGDISGEKALDLACGEGFYTRKLKSAGAREVTGVDVSPEMVRLAEAEERARPTGCRYLNRDAAALVLEEPVDLVVAMYLLNYARDANELLRFVQAAHDALKPGGQFVGFNDNVLNAPGGTVSYARYGFEKEYKGTPAGVAPSEGDPIVYRFTNDDGTRFEFNNYYLSPGTYRQAYEETGFSGFRWVETAVASVRAGQRILGRIHGRAAIIGFAAVRE